MSFWDNYWDEESRLCLAFLCNLKTAPDSDALNNWVLHLRSFFEVYCPEQLLEYSSLEEATFYLILEGVGIVDPTEQPLVDADEMRTIFKMLPEFHTYCIDQVTANGAWAALKFKLTIPPGEGFDLIVKASQEE